MWWQAGFGNPCTWNPVRRADGEAGNCGVANTGDGPGRSYGCPVMRARPNAGWRDRNSLGVDALATKNTRYGNSLTLSESFILRGCLSIWAIYRIHRLSIQSGQVLLLIGCCHYFQCQLRDFSDLAATYGKRKNV